MPKKDKSTTSLVTISKEKQFLSDVKAVIIEVGLGKTRSAILKKQLTAYGGQWHQYIQSDTTHIIASKTIKLAKLCSILKVDSIPQDLIVVNADWLSQSLTKGQLIDVGQFNLLLVKDIKPSNDVTVTDQDNDACTSVVPDVNRKRQATDDSDTSAYSEKSDNEVPIQYNYMSHTYNIICSHCKLVFC